MTKRAVLYARVSSDDRGKDGRNLASQLEMCRKYAQEHGWEVVAELAEDDRGASGASFELPELGRALNMAEAGGYDVLAVRELDRLSRNLAKQLVVEEELNRHDVEVEYVLEEYADTPEGRLNKHIRATIAEYEREKITERMIRGKRNKVKTGSVVVSGNPPYGYQIVEKDGRHILALYEPEARVVRMVFTWYAYGNGESGPMGKRAIASKLTDLGIPTYAKSRGIHWRRDDAPWNPSVIHRMLRSKTYHGTWHFGKKRRNTGGKWEANGDDHLLSVDVPAIISTELWKAVQARIDENRTSGQSRPKHKYLLSRRATCGHCGIKVHGNTTWSRGYGYQYYRCAGTMAKGNFVQDCDAPGFRVDHVDPSVWEWIKSLLTNPEALAQGLWEVHQERERESVPIRDRLIVVDDLLADNRVHLERLLDLYLSGEFPKEMLTDRKGRLEKTILALEKERVSLLAHLEAQSLTAEQIETIQDFAARVSENLEAIGDDFDVRRRIIEALDVQVTLMVEDGKKVAYARCIVSEQICDLRPVPLVV